MSDKDKLNLEERENMNRIYKELLKFKQFTGNKNFKNVLCSINTIISANNFYLEYVCENNKDNYYQRYYRTKKPIAIHSVVYVDFSFGYPKELKYGHWAYVHKVQNGKAFVIPLIPITGNKRWHRNQELEIVIVNHGMMTPVIMKLDEIRWIDIQRIIENHDTPEKVQTPRKVIVNEMKAYLDLI